MKKLLIVATLVVSGIASAAELTARQPVLEPQGSISSPHLTPYRPIGWDDKIVISNVTGSNSDSSPILATDNIRIDWAVRNDGNASTSVNFYIDVLVDGFLFHRWTQPPPLNPFEYTYVEDESIGSLSTGVHTIAIRADPTGTVSESASDRYYERVINIGPAGGCTPSATALCLLSGRFRVTVTWNNQHSPGQNGVGQAVSDTDQTGFFWFFASSSKELVVKLIDGVGLNHKFWVFYGALSDVEYTITVTDTLTSAVQTYHNPPGNICGGADTAAFPSP